MSDDLGSAWLAAAVGLGGAQIDGPAMRRLLKLAVSAIDGEEGSYLALDDEMGDLRFVATVGNSDSEKALQGQRLRPGDGVTGLAAATREVQVGAPIFKDIHQSERLVSGPEAVVAAPLVINDRLLGVMTGVSFRPGRRFGQPEAATYGEFAVVAATLLEQGRRLQAIADLQADGLSASRGTIRAEKEIARLLSRLASRSDETIGEIARLLDAVDSLVRPRLR
jgi:hypothetical protein